MKKVIAFIAVGMLGLTGWSVSAPRLMPFQGRLSDAAGNPVSNGVRVIQFRIYDLPVGGAVEWAGEQHTVSVNGGVVNVMLGTRTPFGTDLDFFDRQLYLEITVDSDGGRVITSADPPMLPRQVILPVLFSKGATEAADSRRLNGYDWTSLFGPGSNPIEGKIPGDKLADASIQGAQIADGAIGTAHVGTGAIDARTIASGVVTANHLNPSLQLFLVPRGGIILWSGSVASIPAGWALCNGQSGTPDLRSRFVVGAGSTYDVEDTGGDAKHSHLPGSYKSKNHAHSIDRQQGRANDNVAGRVAVTLLDKYGEHVPNETFSTRSDSGETEIVGRSEEVPSLPPFYALAYIMKL